MSFGENKCNCGKRKVDYKKPMYPSICGECMGWF